MERQAHRQPRLRLEDYLEFEEQSATRHEFVAGQIHALTGASRRHNRISGNIASRLIAAARGTPCRVYVSDVKLKVADDIVYYPDVMVACGPPGEHPLLEAEPCVVVEVLSPGTEQIDRREKLLAYKAIPTLQAYLIIHQDRPRVERAWRDEEGNWWDADVAGEGRVPVLCPEVTLDLGEIYEGVEGEE
jgi:Uma2 family endonuclease